MLQAPKSIDEIFSLPALEMRQAIIAYTKSKCIEQKRICSIEASYRDDCQELIDEQSILNADLPEIR